MSNNAALTSLAVEAALRAGQLLKKGFGTPFESESKEGKQNIVTSFDKAAERCIIKLIRTQFPHHSFLAEESGHLESRKSNVQWIIDPLDGTLNFSRGIPLFSVSIAAAVEGEVVSGVVFQPMTGELFCAEKGKGAYLNDDRLHVSKVDSFDKAMFATGFPYNVHENPLHCIETVAQMLKLGAPIRRLGSAALDLAYTAAGRFDVYWEVSLCPWDMAAGKLLVEEAGGVVTSYTGAPRSALDSGSLLASNGHLHQAMIEELKKA